MPFRRTCLALLPTLLIVLLNSGARALAQAPDPAPTAVRLTVAGQPAINLTATELARAPRVTVRVTDHQGQPHTYEGVALHHLLALARVRLECRGDAIAQVVSVQSADGYRAVLAIGEVIPDLAPQVVLLADRRDGQPLPAASGPWQLVVPADRKPTRWVRQVRQISVSPWPAG